MNAKIIKKLAFLLLFLSSFLTNAQNKYTVVNMNTTGILEFTTPDVWLKYTATDQLLNFSLNSCSYTGIVKLYLGRYLITEDTNHISYNSLNVGETYYLKISSTTGASINYNMYTVFPQNCNECNLTTCNKIYNGDFTLDGTNGDVFGNLDVDGWYGIQGVPGTLPYLVDVNGVLAAQIKIIGGNQ